MRLVLGIHGGHRVRRIPHGEAYATVKTPASRRHGRSVAIADGYVKHM